MDAVTSFFNHPLFAVTGGVTLILSAIGVIYGLICWILGVSPFIFRIGIGLWKRRVAIFGDVNQYEALKATLVDSHLFKTKNIIHIDPTNLDKAKGETLYLVAWETAGTSIDRILAMRKSHQTAVVVYAPPRSIPDDKMKEIGNSTNAVVVNFRGRLLNDIMNSLITTSL